MVSDIKASDLVVCMITCNHGIPSAVTPETGPTPPCWVSVTPCLPIRLRFWHLFFAAQFLRLCSPPAFGGSFVYVVCSFPAVSLVHANLLPLYPSSPLVVSFSLCVPPGPWPSLLCLGYILLPSSTALCFSTLFPCLSPRGFGGFLLGIASQEPFSVCFPPVGCSLVSSIRLERLYLLTRSSFVFASLSFPSHLRRSPWSLQSAYLTCLSSSR